MYEDFFKIAYTHKALKMYQLKMHKALEVKLCVQDSLRKPRTSIPSIKRGYTELDNCVVNWNFEIREGWGRNEKWNVAPRLPYIATFLISAHVHKSFQISVVQT